MSDRLARFLTPALLAEIADGEKLLASASGGFSDYSFVVFPFAKAYEGFLKKLFFEMGAINEWQFNNDRWRVGRALNPQLEKDLRHEESVYDRIVEKCGGSFASSGQTSGSAQDAGSGQQLAEAMWQAWKKGRNQVFHYFPKDYRPLTLAQAKAVVAEIESVMEKAIEGCQLNNPITQ